MSVKSFQRGWSDCLRFTAALKSALDAPSIKRLLSVLRDYAGRQLVYLRACPVALVCASTSENMLAASYSNWAGCCTVHLIPIIAATRIVAS